MKTCEEYVLKELKETQQKLSNAVAKIKELENFGFELDYDEEYELTVEKNDCVTIYVVESDRKIYVQSTGYVVQELGIIYDLIKADMVEVVNGC